MSATERKSAARSLVASIDITACRQRQADPSWRFARGPITHIEGWIVTLRTADGVRGYGHVLATPVQAPDTGRIEPVLEEVKRLVLGRDAFEFEALYRRLEAAAAGEPCVLSGFACALHDLQARLLGVPLHALLGGKVRDRVEASRIVPIKAPEAMAAQAAELAAAGYRNLKLKLNGESQQDVARVRAVRERVGAAITLTVDANQAYRADDAIEVCRALRPLGVALMEQPVPADDIDGLCRVRAAGALPIEADESYNLKLHYLGGIRNTVIAVRLCEAAGVGYRFGAIFGPRLLAAQGLHVAAVAGSIHAGAELAEFDHLLDDPFEGLEVKNGELAVPDGVASGVRPVAAG
jgi:L-alanine-DL-glutamate epimerase-like enolase superfamily enzyme